MFKALAPISATISTATPYRAQRPNNVRASAPRVLPVASAVRSQISWTAAISGNVIRAVHSKPKPNFEPA